jgi:hypothetical protein
MALTRTLQGTGDLANTTDGASHDGTVDCGTVTSGGILMFHAGGTGGTTGTTWTTPTKSSGTATIGTAVQVGTTAGGTSYASTVMVWRIPITGSGTLVLSTGDASTSFGAHYHAIMYTGQDTTTPIAGAVTQTGTTSLSNSTLGATPAAADEVVAVANWDTDAGAGKGVAVGTNFTERYDTGATDDYVQMQSATRAGSVSVSTTVVWGTQDGTPTVYTAAGVAYIVKAAADSSQALSPTGPTVSVTPGTPALALAVSPTGASVTVTAGTVTVTQPQDLAPTGVTVTVTPGTPTIDLALTFTGPTVSVTPGSLSFGQEQAIAPTGATVTVTPGTPALALAVSPTGPTISVTPGTVTVSQEQALSPVGATVTVTAGTPTVVATSGLYATSVDGTAKKILDQNGDPWYGVGDSAWSIVGQLSTADITTYVTEVAALGFNLVMFSAPEAYYTDNTPAYRNAAGNDPFTGTNFASSLNDAYWDVVDHMVLSCAAAGITCIIVPQYSGYADSADGWSVDVEAAYDASTANLTTYGQALVARYSSYPNIIWMVGHDRVPTTKFKAASKLIADELASGTTHMIIHGGWHTSSTSSTGDTDWNAVLGTDITTDFDTVYVYDETSGEAVLSALATKTSIFLEGKYEQEQSQGVGDQTLREQVWEPFCAGASASIFGNNPRWHFESGKELYAFSGTWQNSLTNTTYNDGSVEVGYFADFLAAVATWAGTARDSTSTFLTAGTGFARFSTTVGIAYSTAASSITLDTTELSGTGNVRIRRYDPTAGTFTTVAASEAQSASRSVTYPGTNTTGGTDWVYVVDLTDGQTISPTGPTVSVTPGTPAIELAVSPTGVTVSVTPGTPAISMTVSLTGTTVTVTPGTPAIALAVTPTGATVSVTPGTPALALAISPTGATVTVTAGSLAFSGDLAIAPTGASVTVTAGSVTIVNGEVAAIYGPALESDPPPILTWNPPPILTHTPPPILKGRSS